MMRLRTRRLVFRCWCEADVDLAMRLWGDRRVTRWIDARHTLDRDAVVSRPEAGIRCEREHGVQYWPIFLAASLEYVGCCGLRPRAGTDTGYDEHRHEQP